MKIVIDTSPLISFVVIDQLEVLEKLFPSIIVPQAVHQEIVAAGNRPEYLKILRFIDNHIAQVRQEFNFQFRLGKGETEAIALCLEHNADLLVIDDRKAKKAAQRHDIKCIGTLGLLTLAKEKGFIKELRKYFIQLLENERYFAVPLLNQVLQSNQEEPLEL